MRPSGGLAWILGAVLMAAAPVAAPAQSTDTGLGPPMAAGGLTFRAVGDGMVLESVSGSGRRDDPFVVTERILGGDPAVLAIEGLDRDFGNRVFTHHGSGFSLIKRAINASEATWLGYRLELQQELGVDSSFFDGLSFAQGTIGDRGLTSDRFATLEVVDEPLDGILFIDGEVAPGEVVRFELVVTDTSPAPRIFLVQQREQVVSGVGPFEDREAPEEQALAAGGRLVHIALP